MPVILTDPTEIETWLTAPVEEAAAAFARHKDIAGFLVARPRCE